MHTRCIVKTRGFTRGVCKNRGSYYIFRFSCGISREQAILRKAKAPRKSPEKWTFLSLAFYNAPSLHIVDHSSKFRAPARKRPHLRWTQEGFIVEPPGNDSGANFLRKGRTWAIAVRRGSYKSLFLPNSGRSSQEK